MKPFDISISGLGEGRKSHLIKTFYQSVTKLLQYLCSSPEKPGVLILAPTGVASINATGTTVHSALDLTRCGKFFPLKSNALAGFRNKY